MIDIICQRKKNGTIQVLHEDGKELLESEFKYNQTMRGKFTNPSPVIQASAEQNGLLHACFKLVADNRGDKPELKTPAMVKYSCKVGIDFRDMSVIIYRPDGGLQFLYRSFAYDKLKGTERIRVIQQALEWLADILDYEDLKEMTAVEQLIKEAKSRMGNKPWHR